MQINGSTAHLNYIAPPIGPSLDETTCRTAKETWAGIAADPELSGA